MQGKTINGFTLQRLLGVGGMAEVWYAESRIGTKAAVKILLEKLSRDEQIQDRFLNEAKVMVPLDHPNIRKVYGYDEIDGRPAIVMEYLDGSDLKSRMKNGQHFSQEELSKWWNQMVDALNYTHTLNIVHRDIKPSNIFIDQRGNAKLLDFGIAKVADTTTGTLTGSTLGTRIYMSPEQVRDPKRVGPASDTYSLAVTFVHLLTGKAPYDNSISSDYDIQESIVRKPVDLGNVPADWQGFLSPYLEKDPTKRPALKPFETEGIMKTTKTTETAGAIGGIKTTGTTITTGTTDDEGTLVDVPPVKPEPIKPKSKKPETKKPSTKKAGPKPIANTEPQPNNDKPNNKRWLWIGLAIAAVVLALALVLLLSKGKKSDKDKNSGALLSGTIETPTNERFVGTWVSPSGDSIAFDESGFTLFDNGEMTAFNMGNIDYKLWMLEDNHLIFVGEFSNGLDTVATRVVQESFEVIAIESNYLTLGQDGYYVTYYKDFAKDKPAEDYYDDQVAIPDMSMDTVPYKEVKQSQTQASSKPEVKKDAPKNSSAGGHEYIDLGLPSGTLWATCNIGTDKPEGYGNYYAWGETRTKTTYDWTTYKYADGDRRKLKKYCNESYYGVDGFTDNLTSLQNIDDPAAVNWGSGWRTPTKEQWEELFKNTTHNNLATQNGVRGCRLTSKKNGQSLFLPYADSNVDGKSRHTGSEGYYWSLSLDTHNSDGAWGINVNSSYYDINSYIRCSGFSVRPVRDN